MLIDLAIALLLVGYIAAGYKDGSIHTLGRLIGAVAGFVVARSWSITLSAFAGILLPSGWARFLTFVAIFFLVNRLIGFLFHILEGPLRIVTFIPFLKTINNLLGGIVGFFEGVVMLGGIIWVITNFELFPTFAPRIAASFVAGLVVQGFNFLLAFVM